MPQRPEENVGSSGTGVTGTCEPPDEGAGNPVCVLCKILRQVFLAPEPSLQGLSSYYNIDMMHVTEIVWID